MMYTAHFVAAVKIDGKTMREFDSDGSRDIFLPFGSDYSLYLKNMDSRRAVVSIEIDGEDALDGTQIALSGNESMELEGFLNGSNNLVKNKFRFIEKTYKVREHRGEQPEDGLIRIEVQFEQPLPIPRPVRPTSHPRDRYPQPGPYIPPYVPYPPQNPWNDYPIEDPWRHYFFDHSNDPGPCGVSSVGGGGTCSPLRSANLFSISEIPTNDDGITVAGKQTHQQFGTTHVGPLDPQKHIMVFRLRGETGQQKPVSKPVTTRKKISCPTCGTKCHSGSRFCNECSTALV